MNVLNDKEIFLSVIIPTCNRIDLLINCLDRLSSSFQSLSKDKYEVIVSDDSFNSAKSINFESERPWVKLVQGPRRGPAANRNHGSRFAKGKWLVFLDDDCIPEPGLLRAYFSFIQSYPHYRVIEGVIKPEGAKPSALAFAPIKLIPGALWSCNFCIEHTFFVELGGFDEMFKHPHMEDKDLQTRIEKMGQPIGFVANAAVVHPWRTLASAKVLGLREEGYIYYLNKHNIPFKPQEYVKKLFFFYASRTSANFSLGIALRLLGQYFMHLYFFFMHYPAWRRMYSKHGTYGR